MPACEQAQRRPVGWTSCPSRFGHPRLGLGGQDIHPTRKSPVVIWCWMANATMSYATLEGAANASIQPGH
jgi:hypothetical protein